MAAAQTALWLVPEVSLLGKEAFLPTWWTPFNKGLPAATRLPVKRWMGLPSHRDGRRPQNFSICSCSLNEHCQSVWRRLGILIISDFSTRLNCLPVSSPKHVASLVMETALLPPCSTHKHRNYEMPQVQPSQKRMQPHPCIPFPCGVCIQRPLFLLLYSHILQLTKSKTEIWRGEGGGIRKFISLIDAFWSEVCFFFPCEVEKGLEALRNAELKWNGE